jgi:excisionase family DNA binding protein
MEDGPAAKTIASQQPLSRGRTGIRTRPIPLSAQPGSLATSPDQTLRKFDAEMLQLARLVLAQAIDEVAQRVSAAVAGAADVGGSRWLDVAEATLYLGLTKSRLYRLTAARAIPYRKIGQKLIFDRYELDEWVEGFPRLDRLS